MRRLILFLIRRKLGLKKKQLFRFTNQKSVTDKYFITDTNVMKITNGEYRRSSVSLNWLLDDRCEIIKIE